MSVSYFRSKLPIFVKFLSHQQKRRSQFRSFHGGFNLLPQYLVNRVLSVKHIDPPRLITNGIRYCHGNTKALAHGRNLAIVLCHDPKIGIQLRKLIKKPEFVIAGLAGLVIVLFGTLERVPYSRRYHVVLSNITLDKFIGNFALKDLKKKYSYCKLLPPDHENSVRVRTILEDIVNGMNASLRLKEEGSVVVVDEWICDKSKENKLEIVSPRRMDYSREKSKFSKLINGTKHLEGLEWEVRVVDDRYTSNACYISRGKIVVFAGLLRELKSDAELAMVLAHEVGHGVAQHISGHLTTVLVILILLLLFPVPIHGNNNMDSIFEDLFSLLDRRQELEADYIGLMLMALAGYDPRAAPIVFEERLGKDSKYFEINSTHPKGEKRAAKLRRPNVMNKAVEIYREVNLGNGVRSFV